MTLGNNWDSNLTEFFFSLYELMRIVACPNIFQLSMLYIHAGIVNLSMLT